jgi:iron(III) transport system substrate-binding protein
MSERVSGETTRRVFLRRLLVGGTALAALPILQACGGASETPSKPAESKPAAAPAAQSGSSGSGIDMEAAKREGKLVWYSPTTEEEKVKFLAAFKAKYPWVEVGEYLRLQTGKLYPKIEEEMAQNVQSCDVLTLSEIALTMDFQGKGYWQPYLSPELERYDKKFKSETQGLWASTWLQFAGIAWNPSIVKSEEAPKTYQDLLDPKWGNAAINMKDSASGLQYAQYVVVSKLHGEGYWDKFAAQKPVGLAGTAQQYEKILNGENKLNGLAQQSTYVLKKKDNAPLEIVFPKEGIPQISLQTGIVKNAPHPNTAKLFIDFLFSEEGQKTMVDLYGDYSPRPGVAPPPHVPKFEELNFMYPDDLDKYIAEQPAWREKWNKIVGV